VALAVSRPEDLEPLGRPGPRLRASAVIDGVTAAAYVVAALGFDLLGLGGGLHLVTLFVTELLLRLFSEPFDLIFAQDRRVVSPWMQCELILALGGEEFPPEKTIRPRSTHPPENLREPRESWARRSSWYGMLW